MAADPTSAAIQAGASIINNTVTQLFQNKVYKSQAELNNAKADQVKIQAKLDVLDNQQKFELASKLQEAKTETEREKILLDTLSALGVTTLTSVEKLLEAQQVSNSKNKYTMAIIIIGGSLALLFAVIMIKKNK